MQYAATIYVGKWTPGEIISEELTEEQVKRLLQKGAIRALGENPAPEAPAEAPDEEPAAPEPEAPAEAPEVDLLDIDAADALVKKPTARKRGGKRA